MRYRAFALLALAIACDRGEPRAPGTPAYETGTVTSASDTATVTPASDTATVPQRLAADPPARARAAAPVPTVTSATTRSVDTTRLADTFISVRVRTAVVTDSVYFTRLLRLGIPFGPYNLYGGAGGIPPSVSTPVRTEPFMMSNDYVAPEGVVGRIASARARGLKLLLAPMGGSHALFKTDGKFDRAKWSARLQTFSTPAIVSAVAAGVADGTIIGAWTIDEPHNIGTVGHLANSWGPPGTFTKVLVDSLCADVKAIFPTLPVGVVHDHYVFEPTKSYRRCDFLLSQYAWIKPTGAPGNVEKFRDDALAMARRDGIAILFSMNILAGGEHHWPKDPWNCPVPPATFASTGGTTGGRGPYPPTCRMTPAQLRSWGKTLGEAGCALTLWRFDAAYVANPDNLAALRDVAVHLKSRPAKSCRRTN